MNRDAEVGRIVAEVRSLARSTMTYSTGGGRGGAADKLCDFAERAESLVAAALFVIAANTSRRGVVMWSVVGWTFGLGSTSATELCQRYGYDPNLRVRDRR